MTKVGKVLSGTVKGAVGVTALACGIVIKGAIKGVTLGLPLPDYPGNPIKEAKELSKYWFEEAKKDFDDASKE